MEPLVLLTIVGDTFTPAAQYEGRPGVRYQDQGSVFTVRHTNDWSETRRDGKCTIRVRIDDDADAELSGDRIRIRPLKGRPGRDEGSECNAPLPMSGNIRDFRFRGNEGRGTARLVQEPGSRNYNVAVVNVQDTSGGDSRYKFELTWNWDGSGGGDSIFPDRPTTGPTPPATGEGIFDGQGTLPDINTSTAGNGTLDDGSQRYTLRGGIASRPGRPVSAYAYHRSSTASGDIRASQSRLSAVHYRVLESREY